MSHYLFFLNNDFSFLFFLKRKKKPGSNKINFLIETDTCLKAGKRKAISLGEKKKLPFYEYERFSWLNQLQCVFESQGKNFHSVPRKGNGESKKKKDNLTINRIKKRERGRKGKKKLKSRARCLIRSRDRK